VEQTLKLMQWPASVGRAPRERLLIAAFLIAGCIFLFMDGRTVPIILWDESRTAANALEMRSTGFSLVTTYEFRPDLWNTKPPLLIWLMTGSMSLFGPSEWAIRLPSALAAAGTLLCLILFVRRVTLSITTALLAAAMLLLSPGFFGEHGARTGDYDALLLFFVTAALQLSYFAIHRARPALKLLVAIGLVVALAGLTKTVSGFVPLAGAGLYLLATGRWVRLLSNWRRYAVAVVIGVAPLLIFYLAREAASPGYLAAAMHNDLGGRFTQPLTARVTGPSYYVTELFVGWFFAGPLLLLAPLAARCVSKRNRALLLWSLYVSAGTLAVYSASSTRLIHYVLPAFPWLATLAAISVRSAMERFVVTSWRGGNRQLAVAVMLALLLFTAQMTAKALHWRYEAFPNRQFPPQASYGEAFAELADRGIRAVTVVDPGIKVGDLSEYAPLVHVHKLFWLEKGFRATHVSKMPAAFTGPLLSCERRATDFWSHPHLERIGHCALLMPKRRDIAPIAALPLTGSQSDSTHRRPVRTLRRLG